MSIKVIQIGVGGFGTSWRQTLSTTPDIEIVALVDVKQELLKDSADFYNVSDKICFLADNKAWTDVEADIVIDSTPQLHHYNNAMQVFSSGKNLIVVKPMSNEWETGVKMVEESEKHNKKMVVAQQLRFHPIIMKIREIIQSGELGKIGYIHQDAFFSKMGYSGSYPQPYPLLVQGAIHFFDYLRWVLDQDPFCVSAECWNTPWIKNVGFRYAYVTFTMSDECKVCFRGIATETDHTNWTCNWRIEGEKGLLIVVGKEMFLNGEKVKVSWDDGKDLDDLGLPELNKIIFEKFVRYLKYDEEPGFSGRNNLKSLEMVFGAIKSSQTGKRYYMEQYRDKHS